jgi:hypothetical protein
MIMATAIKKNSKNKSNSRKQLKTEGPLCEKDEQSRAIEQAKLRTGDALDKWRRLTEKAEKNLKSKAKR